MEKKISTKVTPVCELEDLRQANQKTFLMSDGTETAVLYPEVETTLDEGISMMSMMRSAEPSSRAAVGGQTTGITTYNWKDGVMSIATHPVLGVTAGESVNRIYMTLNFPSTPKGARIKKAELKFKQSAVSSVSGEARFGLYEVTGGIGPGEFTPVHLDTLLDFEKIKVSSERGVVEYVFDVTELLDKFKKAETITPGIMLKLIDEGTVCDNVTLFGRTGVSDEMPTVSVTYESCYDINSAYPTKSLSLGGFGQASIDLINGNLMLDLEDFTWQGNRMPVTLRHAYNSLISDKQYTGNASLKLNAANFSNMHIGLGWRINLMQSMVESSFRHKGEAVDGFCFINENGDETFFKETDDSNIFEDIEGIGMKYDCTERVLSNGDEKLTFDEVGRLISIADEHNQMSIVYTSGRITRVTDGAGRDFIFVYAQGDTLANIFAPNGKVISYTYNSDSTLAKITASDGNSIEFSYSSKKPSAIVLKDKNGVPVHKTEYTYSIERVTSVTEYGVEDGEFVLGTSTALSYSAASHKTEIQVTEPADTDAGETQPSVIKTVYVFDEDGQIASEYSYTPETGNIGSTVSGEGINPLSSGSSFASNIDNLLLDSNFTSNSFWTAMEDNASGYYCRCITTQGTKFGTSHLCLDCANPAVTENGAFQQTDVLPEGDYTFSAYVKPEYAFSCNSGKAGVYLRVTDLSGNVLGESERISAQSNDYTRLVLPFTLDLATAVRVCILTDGEGSVSVNAAQLENNPFANAYNIINNSNFERGIDGWMTAKLASVSEDTCFNMSKCLKVEGTLTELGSLRQRVRPIKLIGTRETYTLSGWAKGSGVPCREREGAEDAIFRLRAEVVYTDQTKESFTADFIPSAEEWQFASVEFCKSEYRAVSHIFVYCEYGYNNPVPAFFDNIQLIRNSVEADLSAADFVVEPEPIVEEDVEETAIVEDTSVVEDTAPSFEEAEDAFGNNLTETTFQDGEFGTIYRSFGYDENGNNLIREVDARGHDTLYTVDSYTSRIEQINDRCRNKTAFEYDSDGKTTKVTSKNASNQTLATVSYDYDGFDNLKEIVRGDGMKYVLAYDAFHNLESIGIDGKAEPLIRYGYKKGSGRLKSLTYANGNVMYATYNSLGQMIGEEWKNSADGNTIAKYKYTYDGSGNIVQSLDISCGKVYNYIYDDGKLVRATESNVILDSNGFITVKDLVNSITYTYDKEDQLVKKTIAPASGEASVIYIDNSEGNSVLKFKVGDFDITSHSKTDSFGRKVFDELQLSKGFVSRQFEYVAGAVSAEHQNNNKLKSSPTTQLVSTITLSDGRTISYEYDNEERITKVTDSIDGVYEYTYDALGQLLTETLTKNGVTTVVNAMTYDNYGNILTKNGKVYVYGDSVWKDKLTSFNGQAITYDAQGNPVTYLGHALTWEKGRQLKSFDTNSYIYNANGIRTSKIVNGIKHDYILDGTKILRETWGNNVLTPLYDNEDSVCGIIYNGSAYYFLKNLQGDVVSIVDSWGNLVARYTYDAWGKCTGVINNAGFDISGATIDYVANINPFRYRGYYLDRETGLYYLQSRYYDPITGRFINGDEPIFLGANEDFASYAIFAYCSNDTINHIDYCGFKNIGLEFPNTQLWAAPKCPDNVLKQIKNAKFGTDKFSTGTIKHYEGCHTVTIRSVKYTVYVFDNFEIFKSRFNGYRSCYYFKLYKDTKKYNSLLKQYKRLQKEHELIYNLSNGGGLYSSPSPICDAVFTVTTYALEKLFRARMNAVYKQVQLYKNGQWKFEYCITEWIVGNECLQSSGKCFA